MRGGPCGGLSTPAVSNSTSVNGCFRTLRTFAFLTMVAVEAGLMGSRHLLVSRMLRHASLDEDTVSSACVVTLWLSDVDLPPAVVANPCKLSWQPGAS